MSITCFILYYAEDQISLRNVYFASVPITLLLYYVYLPSIVETTATVTPT